IAMGVKEHRPTQTRQGRRRQESRTVQVNQIGVHLPRHAMQLQGKSRRTRQEAGEIGRRFPSGAIRPAFDGLRLEPQGAHAFEELASAGQADESAPSRVADCRQQFQKILLSAAGIAELVPKQQAHRRTARAASPATPVSTSRLRYMLSATTWLPRKLLYGSVL